MLLFEESIIGMMPIRIYISVFDFKASLLRDTKLE